MSSTVAHLRSSCMAVQRAPLVRLPSVWTADIKQFNPRFEEGFVAAKDYDPDRCDGKRRFLTCCVVWTCCVVLPCGDAAFTNHQGAC